MLLQKNIIKKYLNLIGEEQTAKPWEQYQQFFMNEDIQANIHKIKEEQFQEGFLRELFVKVLGYAINPSPNYNLTTELKNEVGAKKADGAILADGKVIGVHPTLPALRRKPSDIRTSTRRRDWSLFLILRSCACTLTMPWNTVSGTSST